jgi:hypothetical protein
VSQARTSITSLASSDIGVTGASGRLGGRIARCLADAGGAAERCVMRGWLRQWKGRVSVVAKVVKNRVEVSATPAAVWDRVVDPEGINHEMWPWMTMSMPAGAEGLTVETIPLGKPLGRAWLRLFGLLPFDYDYLTIVEMEPGKRFLERSTMLSMRRWEHERTLTPVPGGTRVDDRVILEPCLPIPGMAAILATVVNAFFKHRQRRLRLHFTSNGTTSGELPTR